MHIMFLSIQNMKKNIYMHIIYNHGGLGGHFLTSQSKTHLTISDFILQWEMRTEWYRFIDIL